MPEAHRYRCLIILLLCAAAPACAQRALTFEHTTNILSACYADDDKLLITASTDGIVKLWDPETGRLIRSFGSTLKESNNYSADFSPNGKLVATIGGRGGRVWNTKFGDLMFSLTGYGDTIKSIHFSSDSKWLLASSLDGSAKLWDVQLGKRHHNLNHMFESLGKNEKRSGVTEAKFCNKEKSIATGSIHLVHDSTFNNGTQVDHPRYDSALLIWDLKTGKVTHVLAGYPFSVSHDELNIISGSANTSGRDARVWNAESGKLILTLHGHEGKVTSCEFSKHGQWILTASHEDGTCRLWNSITGDVIHLIKTQIDPESSASQLSADNKWIVTFSGDSTKAWDAATGKLRYVIRTDRPVIMAANSKRMVVIEGRFATLFDIVTGKAIRLNEQEGPAKSKKELKVR